MDKRSIRTRKWLHEALLDLLKEKSFDAITIQDITRKADIARMTFYRHFQDKDELLQSCTKQFLDGIQPLLKSPLHSKETETGTIVRQNLKSFYDYALEHQETFNVLLTGAAGTIVRKQLRDYCIDLILESLEGGGTLKTLTSPPELVATFVAEGAIGLMIKWLETNTQQSTQLLAETVANLAERGVFGLSLENNT